MTHSGALWRGALLRQHLRMIRHSENSEPKTDVNGLLETLFKKSQLVKRNWASRKRKGKKKKTLRKWLGITKGEMKCHNIRVSVYIYKLNGKRCYSSVPRDFEGGRRRRLARVEKRMCINLSNCCKSVGAGSARNPKTVEKAKVKSSRQKRDRHYDRLTGCGRQTAQHYLSYIRARMIPLKKYMTGGMFLGSLFCTRPFRHK